MSRRQPHRSRSVRRSSCLCRLQKNESESQILTSDDWWSPAAENGSILTVHTKRLPSEEVTDGSKLPGGGVCVH